MTFDQIKTQDKAYILPTYGRVDVALVQGKNARAWDAEGKEYIDFTAGIGVNALGYSDPEWAAAVADQAGKIQHLCNYYYSPENTALAQALCQAQMARLVPGSLKERLNHFVSEHLAEDLSSERICTALGVGRTALYELSKQTYGCGIHEYVRQLRIRHAMQLLTTTTLTNSEICQKIGIADYNYFFRVFRKQTGFTPQAYRKQFGETD